MLLDANALHRRYGAREVVRDVSISLDAGTVLGLLGPNGAGKSTTLQMLAGVLQPHSGYVKVGGDDLRTHGRQGRARIGYLPDAPPLYRDMTVDEYLSFVARLRGVPSRERSAACAKVKTQCDLGGVGVRLIGNLSAGFRQRVGLAQALVHQPPVVLLDEPTVALDPVQLQAVREVVAAVRQNAAVILSSHVLAEVQAMCDQVMIMNRGQVVYQASLAASGIFPREYRVVLGAMPTAEQWREVADVAYLTSPDPNVAHVRVSTAAALDQLVQYAATHGWQLRELTPLATSLERMFLDVVTGGDVAESRHVA